MTTILDLLKQGAIIDDARLKRSAQMSMAVAQSMSVGNAIVWNARVRSRNAKNDGYDVSLKLIGNSTKQELQIKCACDDWFKSGGQYETDGSRNTRPCKHILAMAEKTTIPNNIALGPSDSIPINPMPAPNSATAAPTPRGQPFKDLVSFEIGRAIAALSDEIEAIIDNGGVPLVIGPTGTGKTSAHRLIALRHAWRLVEQAGAASYSDADLIGIVHVNGTPFPGPIADAFGMARLMGQTALLFLDEFTRFNARAIEALMRPLLPIPADAAQLMGIESDVPVRVTSAPFWGTEWAPAEKVIISLACNPWGTSLDPALIRRTQPIYATFPDAVADVFDLPIASAIKATWSAVDEGRWPLPIEYQALARAEGPDDKRIFADYQRKLRALDPAAAEGFSAILSGLGV